MSCSFWMKFETFKQMFSKVHVCRYDECLNINTKRSIVKGEGMFGEEFKVEKPCKIFIEAYQEHAIFSPQSYVIPDLRVFLIRKEGNDGYKLIKSSLNKEDTPFVSTDASITPGTYRLILDISPPCPGSPSFALTRWSTLPCVSSIRGSLSASSLSSSLSLSFISFFVGDVCSPTFKPTPVERSSPALCLWLWLYLPYPSSRCDFLEVGKLAKSNVHKGKGSYARVFVNKGERRLVWVMCRNYTQGGSLVA